MNDGTMTFGGAVRTVLANYADFSGRASRAEYWYWILAVLVVSVALALVDGAVIAPMLGFEPFAPEAGRPLGLLFSLAVLVPSLAVAVRRLHDIGRSGWWLLIQLVPIVGVLLLLWWLTRPSTTLTHGQSQGEHHGS